MRRSWSIWGIFAACLLAVLTAVGWLSAKVVQADRAEALGQLQAEQEENARLALWRMEAAMTALVSQEGARAPPFFYNAFQQRQSGGHVQALDADGVAAVSAAGASADRVLLHFEIDPRGQFSSPQVPDQQWRKRAVPTYLSDEQLALNTERLSALQAAIDPPAVLAGLRADDTLSSPAPDLANNATAADDDPFADAAARMPGATATIAGNKTPLPDSLFDAPVPSRAQSAAPGNDPFGPSDDPFAPSVDDPFGVPAAPAASQRAAPARGSPVPQQTTSQQQGGSRASAPRNGAQQASSPSSNGQTASQPAPQPPADDYPQQATANQQAANQQAPDQVGAAARYGRETGAPGCSGGGGVSGSTNASTS